MMNKIFNLFFLVIVAQLSFAQLFDAKLNASEITGLHQIVIPAELRSASSNNNNFIRIYNVDNEEVPFINFEKKASKSDKQRFKIDDKKVITNDVTSIIILNKDKINLENITLRIANTDLSKTYSISGSNDKKEWFGLVNNQLATNLNDPSQMYVDKNFIFPLNNYKFLKFDFKDKNSLPINVLDVSLEKKLYLAESLIPLQNFNQELVNQKDTKKTLIHITFNTPQVLDEVNFEINGPNYFLRDAKIIVNKVKKRKKRTKNYVETLAKFQLNSKTNNQFSLPNLFIKEFTIEIENKDNPPLDISTITFLQKPISILADLKANQTYKIIVNDKFSAPNYDLGKSGINYNQDFLTASISEVKIVEAKQKITSEKSFWETATFMWVCIILAIIIIGYFSFGLIKDLDKKNRN